MSTLMLLLLLLAALLCYAAVSAKPKVTPTVAEIDAILPQTQCRKCGYPGCKPYAEALVDGTANINQCPPGGDLGVHQLARLLGKPYQPLNPENGVDKPKAAALIDEQTCIGCTLCIQACPVDAIVGAAKLMHTVIIEQCTGCELCLPPCPVDCITMEPLTSASANNTRRYPIIPIRLLDALPLSMAIDWRQKQDRQTANEARQHFEFRDTRLLRDKQEKAAKLAARTTAAKARLATETSLATHQSNSDDLKNNLIAQALARAALQRQTVQAKNTEPTSPAAAAQILEAEARRQAGSKTNITPDDKGNAS